MSWIIPCTAICAVRFVILNVMLCRRGNRLNPSLMAWNGMTHLSVMRSPSASPSGMLEEVKRPWGYLRVGLASDPTGFAASHDRSNTLWRWGKPLPGSLGKDIWHG